MRYRTKLMLILVGLAVLTSGVLTAIMYMQVRRIAFSEIQSKVLSIASTAAVQVDGDLHKQLRTREDEDSPAYRTLEKQLRLLRDANRRDDVSVSYIYTMTIPEDNPAAIQFGVDPEENEEDKSHLGDFYKGEYDGPLDLEAVEVDDEFTVDQWGTWLSANAPIRDSEGRAVAALGVDVSAEDVAKRLNGILKGGMIAMLISVLMAVAMSFVISAWVSRPLYKVRDAVNEIGRGELDRKVDLRSRDEFGELGTAINKMAAGLRERETVKKLFARYVSRQVADNLLSANGTSKAKSDRRRITVMFTDIRGFTKISESLSPEDVVSFLNEYFVAMIEVVVRNRGTLDKFLGDGMMVVFGAPEDDPLQEEHALRAALEMQAELQRLCEKWRSEGLESDIRIGIGINSGNAIVGSIGSPQRMEYTAIGDTVNVAAHIESATKDLGAEILISEYTNVAVRHGFETRSAGLVNLKSRVEPVTVYEVLGIRRSTSRREKKKRDSGILPAMAGA